MSGTTNSAYAGLRIIDATEGDEGPQVVRVVNSGKYAPLARAAHDLNINPPPGINLPITALINTGYPSFSSGGPSGVGHVVSYGSQELKLEIHVDGAAARESLVGTLRARGVDDARPALRKG